MAEGKPTGFIGPDDLNTLAHILHFYERWMLNTMAPSAKRSKNLTEIQFLQVKLGLLSVNTGIKLTYDEVDHIIYAMQMFITQIKVKIPQSKSRDGVIISCEQLRMYIVSTFASKQA